MHSGTPHRWPLLGLAAAAAAAVLLAWGASSGTTGILGAAGTPPHPDRRLPERPTRAAAQNLLHQMKEHSHRSVDLHVLGDAITGLLSVLFVLAILVALSWLAHRLLLRFREWRAEHRPFVAVAFETGPERPGLVDQESVDAARERLLDDWPEWGTGTPRQAILACWLDLKRTGEQAGVVHLPAETSTEFVVRLLHRLDADPRPTARLADLYREARFSTHDLTERDGRDAESAVQAIRASLAAADSRVVTSG